MDFKMPFLDDTTLQFGTKAVTLTRYFFVSNRLQTSASLILKTLTTFFNKKEAPV